MNGVVLHAHPVRRELHNQRNTTGEIATLPKKWLMKCLVSQQNRHQKVFYRGSSLYICAVGLDILKFEQISLFYSASYFNLGVSELCIGGAKPTKSPPWRQDCVAKLQLTF